MPTLCTVPLILCLGIAVSAAPFLTAIFGRSAPHPNRHTAARFLFAKKKAALKSHKHASFFGKHHRHDAHFSNTGHLHSHPHAHPHHKPPTPTPSSSSSVTPSPSATPSASASATPQPESVPVSQFGCSEATPFPIVGDILFTDINLDGGAACLFTANLPFRFTGYTVTTTSLSGDLDLYTRVDSVPTRSIYDCRGFSVTGEEECNGRFSAPGRLYILLVGFGAVNGGTFRVVFHNWDETTVTAANQNAQLRAPPKSLP